MKHKILLIVALLTGNTIIKAQEITAKVTVNAQRINTTIDKRIFVTLQNQLTNFINSRKWTDDNFKPTEKIECNFLLNLESVVDANVYKGQLIIQAARPVFGTTYRSALLNYQDGDVVFKYIEFQPIVFNESRIAGSDASAANLTAIFAFYCNTILGLSYDSFAQSAGQKYFIKAQNIINNAPEGNGINGWRAFDGLRNRYWISENLSNPKSASLHNVLYSYYRGGLDKMFDNEKEGRTNLIQALNQLKTYNTENQNSMFVQFFLQNRNQEISGILKKGSVEEKSLASNILATLDPANATFYNNELR
jgi:Domain of unknown function (DUF4835)